MPPITRPSRRPQKRRPVSPVAAAPAAPNPAAATWTPDQGFPSTRDNVAKLQETLRGRGYRIGDAGVDGRAGANSQTYRSWQQMQGDENQPLPTGRLTGESTPNGNFLSSFRPTRTGAAANLSVGPVTATTGNQTTDAALKGVPMPTFGEDVRAAESRRGSTFEPYRSIDTTLPAKVAVPATTPAPAPADQPLGVTSFGNKVGAAAAGVGNAIKQNPVAALNVGLGAAGLIMNATAKDPKLPAAQDFIAPARAARGMDPAMKTQLRNRIEQRRTQGSQAIGPNTAITQAVRLEAATQAGAQERELDVQDQQMLRSDQDRLDAQQLQIQQQNHQQREQRKLQQFDVDTRRAETQKAQGTALAQGAATYFTQAEANGRQNAQLEIQRQNETDRARWQVLRSKKTSATITPAEAQELMDLETRAAQARTSTTPKKEHGGKVRIYRRGGSVTRTRSTSTGGGGNDHLAQKMSAEFARSINRIAEKSIQYTTQMVRDILKTKTRPLSPSGLA